MNIISELLFQVFFIEFYNKTYSEARFDGVRTFPES